MELNILDWFQTLHTPILDKIMTSITKLGDAGIFWIILTLLFLIIPKMRKTGTCGDLNQNIWNVLEKCCVEFNKKLENFRKI